jgi:hypothetical protein
MKFRHNSRARRPLWEQPLHYEQHQPLQRRYLQAQRIGLSAAVLILVGLSLGGVNNFANQPAGNEQRPTSASTSPLPFLQKPSAQPTPQLPKKTGGNATAASPLAFNHHNVTTTFFWVGEPSDAENAYIPNDASTWDGAWQTHFGGADNPGSRNGYLPAGFTPHENPFYIALPYSDITEDGVRKPSATSCPGPHNGTHSWCKNTWLAIRHGDHLAYAQWEDAGPLGEDDTDYVFGSAAPKSTFNAHAGLDVSPALKAYLGLDDVDHTDWTFVPASQVPAGPWRATITTTPGDVEGN